MPSISKCLAVLVAAATVSLAKTPDGFQPASNVDLIIDYNGLAALNGAEVPKSATQNQPRVAVSEKLTGTSYALIMMDLDIPTNSPPQTSTLLHWMQMDFTPSATATRLNSTAATQNVFLLESKGNASALAPYISPAPPARIPLSHRYTEILVDMTGASASALAMLKTAAATRQGFSAEQVLSAAGLTSKVVAGNSFNVSNAGPAAGSTGTSGTVSSPSGAATVRPNGAALLSPSATMLVSLAAVGLVFLSM